MNSVEALSEVAIVEIVSGAEVVLTAAVGGKCLAVMTGNLVAGTTGLIGALKTGLNDSVLVVLNNVVSEKTEAGILMIVLETFSTRGAEDVLVLVFPGYEQTVVLGAQLNA